ncbi:MAG TPA: hypothetical protein VML96_04965 [Egibacteraceae bacterium]|nr:hypothetical protein [Egibacteraceae bacterium]
MERVNPRELRTAARVADALVYAAGIAGVVAGALLFEAGDAGFAVVAWALTFVAGAGLRLAAAAARALAELLVRSRQMEDDLAALRGAQAAPRESDGVPDPYPRWGGHR